LTRLASLGFDRQSILRQYDRAHQRILNSMSTVRDDQWSLGRDYPNQDPPILSGFVTIEDMFHYPKAHFEQHQRDIQVGLARVEEIMEHARSRRQQGDHEPEPGEPGGLISYPHSPWRRALFKAPISLWRLGLAPLIGGFLMLLTHTGRKTGLPHRTMVEYHKVAGRIYAPCAFGPRSDWFKNVTHDPRVTVQTAGGVEHARAVRVQDDRELLAVYYRFKRRDPPLTRWYLDSVGVRNDPVDVLTKKDRIYWVRFDPIQEQTPAPLKSDLAWVWPLLGIGLLGYWLYSRIRREPS
jgi:deazaflavin-dependent oxidoreductase (nitroreductase family)